MLKTKRKYLKREFSLVLGGCVSGSGAAGVDVDAHDVLCQRDVTFLVMLVLDNKYRIEPAIQRQHRFIRNILNCYTAATAFKFIL